MGWKCLENTQHDVTPLKKKGKAKSSVSANEKLQTSKLGFGLLGRTYWVGFLFTSGFALWELKQPAWKLSTHLTEVQTQKGDVEELWVFLALVSPFCTPPVAAES